MHVRSDSPVALIGAGLASPKIIEEILAFAPFLVAADGGAASVLAAGYMPEAVFGDFDSLAPEVRDKLPTDRLHHVAEQESTDFEKALTRIDAPLILAVGFAGRRLDHELAVYNAIVRHAERACIIVGPHDLVFAAPRRVALDLPLGTRLSLFPLAPVSGRSEGLEWPIAGLEFAPGGRVGTSNRVTGHVLLDFHAPGMLVILPRAVLPAAMAALAVEPAAAPAR